MLFSPQQDAALQTAHEWLQRGEPQVLRIFGYAGTGKTTLAKHLAEGVDGPVYFAAYTGKAAYVLSQKGCPANTIHQLIYKPKNRSRQRLVELREKLLGLPMDDPARATLLKAVQAEEENCSRPMFALNEESVLKKARLLVVDEVSMVDQQMGEDILSFGCQVLVLGDPAQLPPVYGEGFFTKATPDVMLTEIHRQAQDNPIIHLATQLRERRLPRYGTFGESRVLERRQLNAEMVLAADQLIVGQNKTRSQWNNRVRELKGRPAESPVAGDRLVCLRNNHEEGLLNGALWNVHSIEKDFGDRILMKITPETGDSSPLEVAAHKHYFLGNKPPLWERQDAEEFDYGYALTCHKSQGSQWDRVLVYDQSLTFGANRWRWLYTAVTRAAERIDLVT